MDQLTPQAHTDPNQREPAASKNASRAFVAAVIALGVAGLFLPVGQWTDSLQLWVVSMGAYGAVVFCGVYVLWTMSTMPAIPLTILSGALFGPWMGTAYALVGGMVGSAICFQSGRWLGRRGGRDWIQRSPRLARIDHMVGRQEFLVVALLKLFPMFPMNVLNYGLGLTRMRFRSYMFASFAMTVPGALAYAGAGDAIRTAMKEHRVPWLAVGLLAVLFVGVGVLAAWGKRRVRELDLPTS